MAKFEIINTVTRKLHRAGFQVQKHSPEILVGAGIVGVVASAVMACKATTKLDEVLEEPKEKIEKIHELMENPDMVPEGKEYTEEDGKKDLTIMYVQTGVKLVKLYAPSVVLGMVSIGMIVGGHRILRGRYAAMATAYTALNKNFRGYRDRVIERFGEELDRELRYNIKAQEIEETEIAEDGTEVVTKKTVNTVDPELGDYSIYARFFDDGCTGWTKNPEYNLMFLRGQEKYANQLLKTKGYLFLNDVYALLGIPQTEIGQYVGWLYDEKNPIGDNKVDFGIYDLHKAPNRDFVNGYERTILLDFNVDGDIIHGKRTAF